VHKEGCKETERGLKYLSHSLTTSVYVCWRVGI